MRLFGVPKREEDEPVEAEAPQLDSARSVGSGESPAQSSKNSDNASFGQMKLVIKNTFIGGYDEEPDDDPPRTLARSASDSKLDCTSSASSVLFWYPQRKDSMSRSNSSVMSRSDAEDIEDSQLIEHGPAGPYHMVYGRSRATEGSRQSMRLPQDFPRQPPFPGTDMPNHVPAPDDLGVPHSRLSMEHAHRPPGNFFGASMPRPPGMFDGPLQQLAAAQPNIQGRMTGQAPGNYTGDMLPQEGTGLLDMELVKMQAELQKLTATRAGSHQHPELAQMPMSSSADASFRISNFPVPKSDFMAQAVPPGGDLQLQPGPSSASANVAEQQLHHQLLESQMQQLQLQQQMQQLQVQTQRLQQQLAGFSAWLCLALLRGGCAGVLRRPALPGAEMPWIGEQMLKAAEQHVNVARLAEQSSKSSHDAMLSAQQQLAAEDAAVQSADFLAKQPDAETAIQKELHKAREWAAQAQAYSKHAQQTAAELRKLPQEAAASVGKAVEEEVQKEAYMAAERRAAGPVESEQAQAERLAAEQAAAAEPYKQAVERAQQNVQLSLAHSQAAANAVDRLAEESQAMARKAQALQDEGAALPAQQAMLKAHQRMKQSMDMRYWVKKFYKDASQWNDAIGPFQQQQQMAVSAVSPGSAPVRELPPLSR